MSMTAGLPLPGDVGQYAVRGNESSVQAWSAVRLPFEPRAWLLEYRSELRRALAGLAPQHGKVLHAVYFAADTGDLADVENVLLYNIGSKWTRQLMRRGVRFERVYDRAQSPDGQELFPHHQRYEMADVANGFAHWAVGVKIAEFAGVDLANISKPAPVWAAIRQQGAAPSVDLPAMGRYAVRLEVTPPTGKVGFTRSVADIVKPLLDGAICAFHRHLDPGDLGVVIQRLTAAGIGSGPEIDQMLTDPSWGALGALRLVKPFGTTGVQWNPADDRCVAAQVLLRDPANQHSPRWTISGTINTVST